ncbi:hypothetical protein ACSSNL_18090 [Thalassobius sp. S69A]|uniref:hypothetical protein n=1 Tax=unclassified Thalassovita TaxID=2619711 RepID=UPI003C79F61A
MTQTVHPGMIPEAALKGVTTITDFYAISETGAYYAANTALNAPSAHYFNAWAWMHDDGEEGVVVAIQAGVDEVWLRQKIAGSWGGWWNLSYDLSQAEVENPLGTAFGFVSGLRLNQALIAGIGDAMAGMAVDAIGAYGFFRYNGAALAVGATVAGSTLEWASLTEGATNVSGTNPSGTWMSCGHHSDSTHRLSLFRRIS